MHQGSLGEAGLMPERGSPAVTHLVGETLVAVKSRLLDQHWTCVLSITKPVQEGRLYGDRHFTYKICHSGRSPLCYPAGWCLLMIPAALMGVGASDWQPGVEEGEHHLHGS